MWKTCQFDVTCSAIGTFGKHNAQHFGGANGIGTKSFIKIAYPKQQQSIRIFGLYAVVLFH